MKQFSLSTSTNNTSGFNLHNVNVTYNNNNNNNNLLHLYSAFLGTQSALHRRGDLLNHHQCAASTWINVCEASILLIIILTFTFYNLTSVHHLAICVANSPCLQNVRTHDSEFTYSCIHSPVMFVFHRSRPLRRKSSQVKSPLFI